MGQQRIDVAVVTDGPQYQLQDVEEAFRSELTALTSGEFDVQFKPLVAEWSLASVTAAMDAAYRDADVDMVLVLGFAANQLLVSRESFAKPTFLPLVFNPDLLGAPVDDNRSGRTNLNYLADRVPFSQELASFQRVVPFKTAALLVDSMILAAIPDGREVVREDSGGIDFAFIGHDGSANDLAAKIPADVEAVLLGGLPRMPDAQFDQLLGDIASRELPSFSLVSETHVRQGALASDTVQTDYRRLARRNALNMQAVMLGERAENQPVYFEGKRRLTINLETARQIDLSPRFDVLSEAELINVEPELEGPELDLKSVAQLAVERNLDLAAAQLDVRIGEQAVLGARSNLLPQLGLGGNYITRDDDVLIRGPGSAENSASAAVTLNQLIYSDSASSAYQQQQFLQQAAEAGYRASRLDRILEATTAYLQALRADTQLEIQQDNLNLTKRNLELARDRVRVGSASNADIYRWEANLASARSAVLSAISARQQAREGLNRILNQPIATPLRLRKPAKDDPFTMPAGEFDALIDNPRRFGWFMDFNIERGLNRSYELAQFASQIAAVERDIVAKRRAYWLPDFSLQAQYADSIDASGLGSGSPIDTVNDWNVSLNGTLPLFSGGARRSDLSRARLQHQQLTLQQAATAERIEQDIRASFHAAQASYANIELSEQGAEAARKNLDLVSDAYRQGTLSIIDLLDAQNQSLQADLSANNAVHDFLIDIMNLQRATSGFDFLQPAAARTELNEAVRTYIQNRAAGLGQPGGTP